MLTTFTAPAGQPIRVIQIDDKPWFVAADTCRALGLKDNKGGYGKHFEKLQPDEKRLTPMSDLGVKAVGRGGARALLLISESGLYRLVLRRDKPEARAFQDWVTREVLPAIRKDGAYVMGEEKVRTGELTTWDRLPQEAPWRLSG